MTHSPKQTVADLACAGRHADAVQAATTALAAACLPVAERHALLNQRIYSLVALCAPTHAALHRAARARID